MIKWRDQPPEIWQKIADYTQGQDWLNFSQTHRAFQQFLPQEERWEKQAECFRLKVKVNPLHIYTPCDPPPQFTDLITTNSWVFCSICHGKILDQHKQRHETNCLFHLEAICQHCGGLKKTHKLTEDKCCPVEKIGCEYSYYNGYENLVPKCQFSHYRFVVQRHERDCRQIYRVCEECGQDGNVYEGDKHGIGCRYFW